MSRDSNMPIIVCLCGSTRFKSAFEDASRIESLAGKIVLSVGLFGHLEGLDMTGATKMMLDRVHLAKIDLANEVLILNVYQPWCPKCKMFCLEPYIANLTPCCEGEVEYRPYIGASTRNELNYAISQNKIIRFLNPESKV